jgi:transcriptional regulator with XRE-family HTH domain
MELVDRDTFGELLRQWRKARGLSQLGLALSAEVSSRHVCFLETGRAAPSRDMVLLLGEALELPLRERNTLLNAAGFAPVFRQTALSEPELTPVRRALDFHLRQTEPYGAVVQDRLGEVLLANGPMSRILPLLTGGQATQPGARLNMVREVFVPGGMRSAIRNWEPVARSLLSRLEREAEGDGDRRLRALLEEIRRQPGVSDLKRGPFSEDGSDRVLPVHLSVGGVELRLFSTITTLGTPRDITLEELRIESFFPADEASDRAWLAALGDAAPARGG